jgi:hypothetical protein
MKSFFKVSLGMLFLATAGIAAADDIRGGAAVIVVPAHPHHYHHHHHHYYHHDDFSHRDQPRSGVSVGVGIHN